MMGGMGPHVRRGAMRTSWSSLEPGHSFSSQLGWDVLGAIPETLQTAYGSARSGCDLQAGQILLSYAAAPRARVRGASRSERLAYRVCHHAARVAGRFLETAGSAALVDDGDVAAQVRARHPEGVDAAIELIGTPTLPDTLRATKVHGTVCFNRRSRTVDGEGLLSNRRRPPACTGSRRTAATTAPSTAVLQRFLDRIASGAVTPVESARTPSTRSAAARTTWEQKPHGGEAGRRPLETRWHGSMRSVTATGRPSPRCRASFMRWTCSSTSSTKGPLP